MLACSKTTKQDLYGTYFARYSFGKEILILRPNGEYIQEVSVKGDTKILIHKGQWSYNEEGDILILEKALIIAEMSGGLRKNYQVPSKGIVATGVTRIFHKIMLGTGDEGVYLVKQE